MTKWTIMDFLYAFFAMEKYNSSLSGITSCTNTWAWGWFDLENIILCDIKPQTTEETISGSSTRDCQTWWPISLPFELKIDIRMHGEELTTTHMSVPGLVCPIKLATVICFQPQPWFSHGYEMHSTDLMGNNAVINEVKSRSKPQ